MGEAAAASGLNAIAVGNESSAGFDNSVAIGNGATTTRANQVAVGGSDSTYTMSGINSAASTSSQSGPIGLVTTDQNGNLAADYTFSDSLTANSGAIAQNTNLISLNTDLIARNSELARDNQAGIAAAMALDMPFIAVGHKYAVSSGFGFYGDETAFSAAGAFRVSDHLQFNAGLSTGLNRGETGGRVGLSASW